MSEVNIWTNRALTELELSKIESTFGFELHLDYNDFSHPDFRHTPNFANYILGINDESKDEEILAIYNHEWADDVAQKIKEINITAIFRTQGVNCVFE
jgi:hypothetical protein